MSKKASGRLKGLLIILGMLAITLAIYFSSQKQGYYIDEYYTYTLSNGSQLGIAIENGKWNDTAPFMSQLISEPSENFRFAQCYENNQNDVHPPLYYFLIHIVSSIFSGQFSKWIGISVNLILWIPCMLLAGLLAYELAAGNKPAVILAFVCYAFSPAVLSGIMLIRMYVMLQLFVMLSAYLLTIDLKRRELSITKHLLPVFVTIFAGFLTQYYYVIACFFLSLFYCIALLLISLKNIKRVIAYGITAFTALCSTYVVWPTSVFHIFKGYRGEDSVNSLLSVSNISSRASLFIGNLNRNVYGGLLIVVAAAFIIGAVDICVRIKRNGLGCAGMIRLYQFLMLVLSSICYFVIISKIGLKAGAASNRYVYPVYGLFIILTVIGFIEVLKLKMKQQMAWSVTLLLMIVILISAFVQKQVLYLYPEEEIINTYLAENADVPMIVVNKDDGSYDRRMKDYLQRTEVYFAGADNKQELEDERIAAADRLIVYIQEGISRDEALNNIKEVNSELVNARDIFTDAGSAFTVVEMSRYNK